MKLGMKEKRIYSVFWVVTLLSYTLFINNICAQTYGAQYISYASNITGDYNIYLIDTNGENLGPLTNHPADERDPTWSPDGRFLAYASNRDGDLKIYVMDTKTGQHRRLTDRHEEEWAPAWSPDGKWIAFVSGSDEIIPPVKFKITSHIYKTDINGAHPVQLTDQGKNLKPAWSPDSQWIAFVSYHRGDDRKGIYVMDADGRRLRRIDDKKVQALNGIFQSECAWSPDGKQIAFSMIVPRNDRMHLGVIDIDGKNFHQLTQGGPILRPVPVGQVIVNQVIKFPLPEIGSPVWSPNSKWIAYVYSDTVFGGTADIYVIEAEGNGRGKPFVNEIGRNLSPAWVPEGFLSVSPDAEKQTTLWGRLKQTEDTSK